MAALMDASMAGHLAHEWAGLMVLQRVAWTAIRWAVLTVALKAVTRAVWTVVHLAVKKAEQSEPHWAGRWESRWAATREVK